MQGVRGGDCTGRVRHLPVRRRRPIRDIAGIRLCSGRITERLALPPLNEHDPDLGVVTPDDLACSSRMASLNELEHPGNAGCGLNL